MRLFGHRHHRRDDPWAEAPPWAIELREMLGLVIDNQGTIMATQAEIKVQLDAITADVADETTQIAGIETVLDNLAAIIAKLQADATNAQVDPAIVAQITALQAAVGGNKARIIDDIKKNTPAA